MPEIKWTYNSIPARKKVSLLIRHAWDTCPLLNVLCVNRGDHPPPLVAENVVFSNSNFSPTGAITPPPPHTHTHTHTVAPEPISSLFEFDEILMVFIHLKQPLSILNKRMFVASLSNVLFDSIRKLQVGLTQWLLPLAP